MHCQPSAPVRPTAGTIEPRPLQRHRQLRHRLAILTALVAVMIIPTALGQEDRSGTTPATEEGGATQRSEAVEQRYRALASENARLREQLRQAQRDSDLAARIAAQTDAIEDLAEGLRERQTTAAAGDGSGAGAQQSAGGVGTMPARSDPAALTAEQAARLRANLEATETRLALLIDQFAAAHELRRQAEQAAASARNQIAELDARLQQQQLVVQEAQLRAEKAEKLHAALEEAHAKAQTNNEKLSLELTTARERLAEALQQIVALNAKLVIAEARIGQLQPKAKAALERPGPQADPAPDADTAPPADEAAGAGAVDSAETDDGNHSGSQPNAGAAPAAAEGSRSKAVSPAVYLVRAEDTLSRISAKVYGNPNAWRRIFEANRDVLATPDELAPGMTLVIP